VTREDKDAVLAGIEECLEENDGEAADRGIARHQLVPKSTINRYRGGELAGRPG